MGEDQVIRKVMRILPEESFAELRKDMLMEKDLSMDKARWMMELYEEWKRERRLEMRKKVGEERKEEDKEERKVEGARKIWEKE